MKKTLDFLSNKGIYLLLGVCLILGLTAVIFKNATLDDDLYLWETSMMTEALSRGEWFGDYAVGTHGFLFKLPVALIFLLSGPSLAIATVWNVLLACFSLYLFYKILKHFFPKGMYPFLGSILLFCNFQFILNLPTYMREFPVFLSLLLLVYFLIKKKSYWLMGFSLLLILDAKEYVLFMILPALFIYILVIEWKGLSIKGVLGYIKAYFKLFVIPVVFLLLMIFTSLIPLNMYALSIIPGVTKGGIEYQIMHFNPDMATTNRIKEATTIKQDIEDEDSSFEKGYKVIISYIGKILYPRSFSFLSIPKIIFLPALLTSILLFKRYLKEKSYSYIGLSLIFWSFISIFILRASFDRYLFPILPIVVFFFLIFLKELVKERKVFLTVILATSIFVVFGLFFESEYIWVKLILNISVISLFILYSLFHKKLKEIYIPLLLVLSGITFSVIAFFFYANGQLHQYILWGNDYEIQKVVTYFEDGESILLNDVGWDILPKVYRGDNRYNPEWKWELQDWVPRKKNLKMFDKFTTYGIYGNSIEGDRVLIESNNIKKIGLMVSTIESQPFKSQNRLNTYLELDWLSLSKVVNLKNKDLYIFEVLE